MSGSFWQRQHQQWGAWWQLRRAKGYSQLPDEEAGKTATAAAGGEAAAPAAAAAKAPPPGTVLFTPFAVPAAQQQQQALQGHPSSDGTESRSTNGVHTNGTLAGGGGHHPERASSLRAGGGTSPRAVRLLLPHGSLIRQDGGAGSAGPLEVLEEEASQEAAAAQGGGGDTSGGAPAGRATAAEQPGSSAAAAAQPGVHADGGEVHAADAVKQGLGAAREEQCSSGSLSAQSADSEGAISEEDIECGRLGSLQSAMLRLESVRSAQRPDQALLPVAHAPSCSPDPGEPPREASVALVRSLVSGGYSLMPGHAFRRYMCRGFC